MPLTEISASDKEQIQQFREHLRPLQVVEEHKLESDYFVWRYLRAGGMNFDKAEGLVRYYAGFVKENNPETLISEQYPEDFSDKFFCYIGGHDHDGRPIICIPQGGTWNLRKAIEQGREEMFIRYVLKVGWTFEQEILKRNSDYGILVVEISNVAYGNYLHKRTLEVLLKLGNLMEKLAPMTIKKVYFVNAPKIWVAFFNTVRALVSVSADIYAFDANEVKWKAAIADVIPEDGMFHMLGGTSKNYERI